MDFLTSIWHNSKKLLIFSVNGVLCYFPKCISSRGLAKDWKKLRCIQVSSNNLCLFGDVSNALQQQVSSHTQFINMWRTWIKFTLFAEVYLMGIGIKHCSLMMSLARPFEIQNGAGFFLNHSKEVSYQKTRCNG